MLHSIFFLVKRTLLLAVPMLMLMLLIFVPDSASNAAVDPQEYAEIQQVHGRLKARTGQIKALTSSDKVRRRTNDGLLEPVPNQTLSIVEQTLLTEENTDRRKLFEFVAKYSEPRKTLAEVVIEFTTGWSQEQPPPPANVILRLHGSKTIGAELVPQLASEFLKSRGYTNLKTDPIPSQANEWQVTGQRPGSSVHDVIEIKAHGSSTAFDVTPQHANVGLKDGYCDIGMASRRLSSAEANTLKLAGLGDLFSRKSEHVIGFDSVVIIVSQSNQLRDLDVNDLRQIFQGNFSHWKQVPKGTAAGAISLYPRDKQSLTYETFRDMVMSGTDINFTLPQIRTASNGKPGFEHSHELAAGVASDPYGIGFIGLSYAGNTKPVAIRLGSGLTVLPDRSTIQKGTYPLSQRLYLYLPEQPHAKAGANYKLATDFIAFVKSDQGQDIVDKAEFVSLKFPPPPHPHCISGNPYKNSILSNSSVPETYKSLIHDAYSPLNIYFDTDHADFGENYSLEQQAYDGLDRLKQQPQIGAGHAEIRLLGFADSRGEPVHNSHLSIERANFVATQMRAKGFSVAKVDSFGSNLSLQLRPGSFDPTDLQLNRRVEVWIKCLP